MKCTEKWLKQQIQDKADIQLRKVQGDKTLTPTEKGNIMRLLDCFFNDVLGLLVEREKELHEINLLKWVQENQEKILSEYSLHSQDGFTPQELLAYFIKKEILGEI